MFGRKRRAAASARASAAVVAAQLDDFIESARTFGGATVAELGGDTAGFVLADGERCFGIFVGTFLIEPRSGGGSWQGRSQGVSVPVAFGLRYRIGASKGQYVKHPDVPTPIDEGNAIVTDRRVMFAGNHQTREWVWAKCIAIDHHTDAPWTGIAVSNREKISGLLYDDTHAPDVRFRLDLAHAVATGSVATLIAQLEQERATLAPRTTGRL